MRAALNAVDDHARAHGRRLFTSLDNVGATWMLADYVDVVVHLFDEEHREFYDLDGLWGDAPQIDWSGGEGSMHHEGHEEHEGTS